MRVRIKGLAVVINVLLAAVLLRGVAASSAEEHDGHDVHAQPHSGEEHYPRHVIGLFVGDTHEDSEEGRRDGLTLGAEYEYRVSETFGAGLILEHVAGDFDVDILVLPVAYHNGPWKFYAGPGIEKGEEEEFMFRVGVEYGFHVGDYEVSPQVDLDFVAGERLFVFGVVFARHF